PDHPEGGPADVPPRERVVGLTLVHPAGMVEERVDLAGVVPRAQSADGVEHAGHHSSSAASCPHAPSMSLPRVSRTVVGTPWPRRVATNSASTSGSLAVHFEPGVGLSGIGLTCTQPRPRSVSSRPSRSARQAWSLM